ncbi:hypothetical protein [Flavobacterium sp. KACC 22761]|nr:hypothetical protein [Flavobacterium sp. KACC 22761]WPO78388.1 hypothetical protein SCB73_19195 [Flavobacterium sp. KACC 22761]
MKPTTEHKENAKAKKGIASSKNEATLKSEKKQTIKMKQNLLQKI